MAVLLRFEGMGAGGGINLVPCGPFQISIAAWMSLSMIAQALAVLFGGIVYSNKKPAKLL